MKNIKLYKNDSDYQSNKITLPEVHVACSEDTGKVFFGGITKVVDYITEEEYGTAVFDIFRTNGWIASNAHVMTMKQAAAVKAIGNNFSGNTNITNTWFLKYFTGLTTQLGTNFNNCSGITKAYLPATNPASTKNGNLYGNCSNIKIMGIAEGVTIIPTSFCRYCNIEKINFPNSLTSIDDYILGGLLFSVVDLRNTSCTKVGISFGYNANTTVITALFPSTLTTLGNDVFKQAPHITNIVFTGTTPPTVGSSFCNTNRANVSIFVPSEAVDAYKAVSGLSNFTSRIYAIGGEEWDAAGLSQYE